MGDATACPYCDLGSRGAHRAGCPQVKIDQLTITMDDFVKRQERLESDRAALLAACEAMAAALTTCRKRVRDVLDAIESSGTNVERYRQSVVRSDAEMIDAALATYARARGEAARGESED